MFAAVPSFRFPPRAAGDGRGRYEPSPLPPRDGRIEIAERTRQRSICRERESRKWRKTGIEISRSIAKKGEIRPYVLMTSPCVTHFETTRTRAFTYTCVAHDQLKGLKLKKLRTYAIY